LAEPRNSATTQQVQVPTRIAGKVRAAGLAADKARGETLTRDDRIPNNQTVRSRRFASSTAAAQMRLFAETDGILSTAILQYIAMAKTRWRVLAYQPFTQEFSPEGLKAAETLISALDTLWSYTSGYQDKRSLSETIETLLLEAMLSGGIAAELVLDTNRLPQQIFPFAYETITWKANGRGGRYPVQKPKNGNERELNYPNIFVAECLKPADRLYAIPAMISGFDNLFAYAEFVEDMRRVLKRAGGPRLLVKLDYQKVAASAPADVQNDGAKLKLFLDQVKTQVESDISNMAPEDALVYYDIAEVDSVATEGEKKDYADFLKEMSGLAASAIKTNPSMIGLRMGGSQNVASTETMLALNLAALFQDTVETVLSRALTLAVRLYGVDAYVKFKFEAIDLRPELELEAHKSIKQNRMTELLSIGRITDEEYQAELGLGSIPEGAPRLSGTMFYQTKAQDTVPTSQTNARNQDITPSTPTSAGGKDNEKRSA